MQAEQNENGTKTEQKEDGMELKMVRECRSAGKLTPSKNLSNVNFLLTHTVSTILYRL